MTVPSVITWLSRQKDRTLKDELPRSVGAQYATGDQCKNNSRKNEMMEPKQKPHPAVDVTGDGSKVQRYKEQYSIGTWDVRSMTQGKLEVVKQEMARVNIDISRISELWYGEGGGRRVQDGEHMYNHDRCMLMYGKTNTIL